MTLSYTANLALKKPARGDDRWDEHLNDDLDSIDGYYGTITAATDDLPVVERHTGTFNGPTGAQITLAAAVDAVNEYGVQVIPTTRAAAIGDIYVTKATDTFTVHCAESNTSDTFEAIVYKIGDVASYGGSIYRRYYVSPDTGITDHSATGTTGSLAAVLNGIGSTKALVELPGNRTYTLTTADLTVASNIVLRFQPGAIISVPSGRTLTINGYIEAGDYQIFTGAGLVDMEINGNGRIEARWFGAHPDSADNNTAFYYAWCCLQDSDAGVLHISSGTYFTTCIGHNVGTWTDANVLSGKHIEGDPGVSKLKLVAGENTALFDGAFFTGGMRNLRFDGNNPADSWGGAQNNPTTENLVVVGGYGYEMVDIIAEFSGGNGFYLKGETGIISIRGANGKAWFNNGWGYVITTAAHVRMYDPWIENNTVGGILIENDVDTADTGSVGRYIGFSSIQIINPYFERYTNGPTTGIKISGMCGVLISGLARLIHISGDIGVHIAANTNSDAGYQGSHYNVIEHLGHNIYVTVDDGCKHNEIRSFHESLAPQNGKLYLTDNDGTTIVQRPISQDAYSPGGDMTGNTYGYLSNFAQYQAKTAGASVVDGGILGPVQDWNATHGGPACIKIEPSVSPEYVTLYNNHVLPVSTQLYLILGLWTQNPCKIDVNLEDAVNSEDYDFISNAWGVSGGRDYPLGHTQDVVWYKIPFTQDTVATRKLRIQVRVIDYVLNTDRPIYLYHAFITDAPNSAIYALRGGATVGINDMAFGTNANRPPASDVPAGTMLFNTDDGFPNWSDGTNWVTAAGAVT